MHRQTQRSPEKKSESVTSRASRVIPSWSLIQFVGFWPRSKRCDLPCALRGLCGYRKGVSFLSRIIGTKKKEIPFEAEDDISEPEASRMSVDTSHPIGFIPRHPAPARYLRVRAHNKKDKTFNRVFLAQELDGTGAPQKTAERRASLSTSIKHEDTTGKAVWALAFSEDGKYLAAAGQDKKVRVWAVISTPEERETATRDEERVSVEGEEHTRLKAPVFHSKPIQTFDGHTGSILDLSWSKVRTGSIPEGSHVLTLRTEQLHPFLVDG